MKCILKTREMGLVYIIIFISTIITIMNPIFLRPDNLIDLVKGNCVLAIISLGMLFAILTRGVDASVGGIVTTVTVVVGNFMLNVTGNVFIAFIIGSIVGIALGMINGLLISQLEIPPIVATLGTYSVISGTMLYITSGKLINNLPESFKMFGNTTVLKFIPDGRGHLIGIPVQILIMVLVSLITAFLLKYTLIGRGVYALGGNEVSASRTGYNPKKITIFIYCFIGFLCGIAGVTHVSIMKQIDPNAFIGYDLKSVGAVILGGASVAGGEGTVTGTLLGVLIFAIINNGLILVGISSFWQKIITGTIIVAAVSFNLIQKKHANKKLIRVDIDE